MSSIVQPLRALVGAEGPVLGAVDLLRAGEAGVLLDAAISEMEQVRERMMLLESYASLLASVREKIKQANETRAKNTWAAIKNSYEAKRYDDAFVKCRELSAEFPDTEAARQARAADPSLYFIERVSKYRSISRRAAQRGAKKSGRVLRAFPVLSPPTPLVLAISGQGPMFNSFQEVTVIWYWNPTVPSDWASPRTCQSPQALCPLRAA